MQIKTEHLPLEYLGLEVHKKSYDMYKKEKFLEKLSLEERQYIGLRTREMRIDKIHKRNPVLERVKYNDKLEKEKERIKL